MHGKLIAVLLCGLLSVLLAAQVTADDQSTVEYVDGPPIITTQVIHEKPEVITETVLEPYEIEETIHQSENQNEHIAHIGCFRDKSKRDLPKRAVSGKNSVQLCRSSCRRLGYKFAGVQYSKECWCGNKYGSYGRAKNCNMKCTGNKGQTCGGVWANNVYRTSAIHASSSSYPHATHIGCFRDKSKRDLPKRAISGKNSVQLCRSSCRRLGYKFAGVQYSKECWCGNKYGSYGRAKNCNMKCTGNKGQTCGGVWANNVYRTNRRV